MRAITSDINVLKHNQITDIKELTVSSLTIKFSYLFYGSNHRHH